MAARGALRSISRVHVWVGAITTLVVSVMVIVGAVAFRGEADRSQRVQQHGVQDDLTVAQVHYHPSRHGKGDTVITGRLAQPVRGSTTTTVHVRGDRTALELSTFPIQVVVDPHQPGYSELRGEPFATQAGSTKIFWLGSAGVLLGLVLVCSASRSQRRERAAADWTPLERPVSLIKKTITTSAHTVAGRHRSPAKAW